MKYAECSNDVFSVDGNRIIFCTLRLYTLCSWMIIPNVTIQAVVFAHAEDGTVLHRIDKIVLGKDISIL